MDRGGRGGYRPYSRGRDMDRGGFRGGRGRGGGGRGNSRGRDFGGRGRGRGSRGRDFRGGGRGGFNDRGGRGGRGGGRGGRGRGGNFGGGRGGYNGNDSEMKMGFDNNNELNDALNKSDDELPTFDFQAAMKDFTENGLPPASETDSVTKGLDNLGTKEVDDTQLANEIQKNMDK